MYSQGGETHLGSNIQQGSWVLGLHLHEVVVSNGYHTIETEADARQGNPPLHHKISLVLPS